MISSIYRGRDGKSRVWYEPSDIEWMMEDELTQSELFPSFENPVVKIEEFVECRLRVRLDQYADLESDVLGQTEFYPDNAPSILINKDLTGAAIDEVESAQGLLGRWRATLAHEASHVIMHRMLFERTLDQRELFAGQSKITGAERLMRCMKKNVLFRGGGSDWREVQANMGMAALLMPQTFFRKLSNKLIGCLGLAPNDLVRGSAGTRKLTSEIASTVGVSSQAASIRLETLGITAPVGQAFMTG